MKKLIGIILTIVTAFTLTTGFLPVSAAADEEDPEELTYEVNGHTVPFDVEDYRNGDFYGQGECWWFAQDVYRVLWEVCDYYDDPITEDNIRDFQFEDPVGFTSTMGTDYDMLRDYPTEGFYRKVNRTNTVKFITAAEVGAVIRMQVSLERDSDNINGNQHSVMLVYKDEDGCAIYHDWASHATLEYLTWDEYVEKFEEYGYYKYIKWPDAEALEYVEEPEDLGSVFYATISNVYDGTEYYMYSVHNEVLLTEDNPADQTRMWKFKRLSDGSYKIAAMSYGRYLQAKDSGTATRTKLVTTSSNSDDSQRWYIYLADDGYNLVPAHADDMAADTYNAITGSVEGNPNVQLQRLDGSAEQIFKITKVSKNKAVPDQPVLTRAETVSDGIIISWEPISSATYYKIYRRVAGGSWKLLSNEAETTYTDETAVLGKTYYYMVRACNRVSGTKSTYDHTGTKVKRTIATPQFSAYLSGGHIVLKWDAVSGADGYRVYRKAPGGSWQRVVLSTTELEYTDEDSEYGELYYYRVRAYAEVGSTTLWSSYIKPSPCYIMLNRPGRPDLEATDEGVEVTWEAVTGATGYSIYRKVDGDDGWTCIKSGIEGLSYTDETARQGETYRYSVRAYCRKPDGTVAWSNYNKTGRQIKVPWR